MHNQARISALYIVPNRDVDLFQQIVNCSSYYTNIFFHTPLKATTLESPSGNLVLCADIFALNSPILIPAEYSQKNYSVPVVLLAPESALDLLQENSFDVYIEYVDIGKEAAWLQEVHALEKKINKTEWNPLVKEDKLITQEVVAKNIMDGILEHIEQLKKKEIIHRYNLLRYSLPASRRNLVRDCFARYMAGIMSREEFHNLACANDIATEHVREIDAFLKSNPNYTRGFRIILEMSSKNPVDSRVVQGISEEFDIPVFELNYFALKADAKADVKPE